MSKVISREVCAFFNDYRLTCGRSEVSHISLFFSEIPPVQPVFATSFVSGAHHHEEHPCTCSKTWDQSLYFSVRNSNLSLLILLKVHGPYCNWRENYSTNQSRPRTTFSHRCWILLRPGTVPCTDHGWEFIVDTTCANICLNSLRVVFNLLLLCSILFRCQPSRYGFSEFALPFILISR